VILSPADAADQRRLKETFRSKPAGDLIFQKNLPVKDNKQGDDNTSVEIE